MVPTASRDETDLHSGNQQLEMLIASIVEVTKQRERIALEDCFARLVVSFTSAKTLTIYHLQPHGGDFLVAPVMQLADGEKVAIAKLVVQPFLLSSDAPFAATLRQTLSARDPAKPVRVAKELILPLRGAHGDISAFCKVEDARNAIDSGRLLPLVLEFYTNFLSLLDDNERDTLTGLLNRKTFDMRIGKILSTIRSEVNRATDKAITVNFCLAALDIDHFKKINDTVGHVHGDEVLLLFSNLMKTSFRDNDLLFRFGGEEFVILLANADMARARIALERFRSAVANKKFPQIGQVTVSIGVASIASNEMPRTTIDRADQALYFAKHNGRNQVRVYEELVKAGLLKAQNIKPGEIELF